MRTNSYPYRPISWLLPGLLALLLGMQPAFSQASKKNTVRLKVNYTKVMDTGSYLDIEAIARIDKQMVDVAGIELEVFNEVDGEEISLGQTKTNHKGASRFTLPELTKLVADTAAVYTLGVSFGGDDAYKRASRSVQFKDAELKAGLMEEDSVHYVSATLTDAVTHEPIPEQNIRVQVKRLLRPLRIGEEFNFTDEEGSITTAIDNDIPGLDGILDLEVVLSDSDQYGTVMSTLKAPVGVPIVPDTTMDTRTLWSPRSKTPVFIIVFTVLLILVTWGPIVYLLRNLFKINKS